MGEKIGEFGKSWVIHLKFPCLYHILQVVRGGKVLRLQNLILICLKTFAVGQWSCMAKAYCTSYFTGKVLWYRSAKTTKFFQLKWFAIYGIHNYRYTVNVFSICLDYSLFAKFFLANSFYLYGLPKFSPAKFFPCMVCIYQ